MTLFAPAKLQLRQYQIDAVNELREGVRAGHRAQILCMPTAGGKTECAIHLIEEAIAAGSKVAMVCDRRVLVNQTSARLAGYGIRHGIAMAGATRGAYEQVQVCSAQTIEKRGFWPELDVLIIDEAHTQRQAIVEYARKSGVHVVGLTATPLTPNLRQTYTNIVNATTTNQLLKQGWLAPLKLYQAQATIDMEGAKKTAGEWQAGEVRTRSRRIIGDIVGEWVRLTQQHFGGPVKTLLFSADVAHGEELCKAFQAAGYDFRQSTYEDNDTATEDIVNDFRQGRFTGLVSVEKFVKGFDVPDVLCLVGARPYSSSLASVIQQMGRGMRTAAGKDYCLYLDFAENLAGWWEDVQDVWEFGVPELPPESKPKPQRKERGEREDVVCPKCGYVGMGRECLGCGYVWQRRTRYETEVGRMAELVAPGSREWKANEPWVWAHVCSMAIAKRAPDLEAARKTAAGYYKNIYGDWPHWGRKLVFTLEQPPDPRVVRAVTAGIRKWRNGK